METGNNQLLKVANWVKPQHHIPLLILKALYTNPVKEIGSYRLDKFLQTERVKAYYSKMQGWFVAIRGTTLPSSTDILSDLKITGFVQGETVHYQEAKKIILEIRNTFPNPKISVGGHSLGGTTALQIATDLKVSDCCAFNPGATAFQPIINGPGQTKSTTYHIVGDLISSHISDSASTVIRADQKLTFYETLEAHKLDRFWETYQTFGFMNSTQEDLYYRGFALLVDNLLFLSNTVRAVNSSTTAAISKVLNTPIPGAQRHAFQVFTFLGVPYAVIQDGSKSSLSAMTNSKNSVNLLNNSLSNVMSVFGPSALSTPQTLFNAFTALYSKPKPQTIPV